MSTRAIIARLDPRSGGWEGVYLNNGGEPEHVIPILHRQVTKEFANDIEEACDFYVARHPGGWYSLGKTTKTNVCYCHPEERPALGPITVSRIIPPLNWTYILRWEGLEVRHWHQSPRQPLSVISWKHDHPTMTQLTGALELWRAA